MKPLSKETLTRRYYSRIYSFCARRMPDRESAEDAVQEVFAAFWEGPDFTEEEAAAGWLYRVARSKISDFYRARARRAEFEADVPPEDLPEGIMRRASGEDPTAEEALGTAEKELLGRLSPGEAELFRDAFLEEMTYAALAEKYGASEGAMRIRVHRLRKKITEILRTLMTLSLPLLAAVLFRNGFMLISS